MQQLTTLLQEQRRNPRRFWQSLRSSHSELPCALQNVQSWDTYLRDVTDVGHIEGCHLPPDAYPLQFAVDAPSLNVPISLQEVQAGLQCLHNGRASGKTGIPAELFRYAQHPRQPGGLPEVHLLAPSLTKVLDSMFQNGIVPEFINVGLVTPVFKRGDPFQAVNYRPITVTEPLLRLYAIVLNKRLQDYTENNGLRAETQTGFRPGFSTTHQLFALQAFVDGSQARSVPLYTCFLDLTGAYDRVQRQLLWQILENLGIHGPMLIALQSLYCTSALRMRVQGRAGPLCYHRLD